MGATVGTATILFSDVVASTRMRAALGDPAADELRRRHDAVLTAVVDRHEGTVVKHLGDGLMASFRGSAEAVAAAVDMQREIAREFRRADDDRRIAIRVGLSAGDVTFEDGDCHGTPVVTAARLCDAAESGQVLCDDLVRGLARGRIDLAFAAVGELDLKGLAEPVSSFEVPWEAVDASAGAPLPGPLRAAPGELPYAGRIAELTRLRELWKATQADGASVVLVAGEPGIGKSRLVAELARDAHAGGATVVLGRCDEQVPAPHAPWIEALRSLVAHADEAVLADHVAHHAGALLRLVPELATRVPGAVAPVPSDPDTERLLLFDAVTGLLSTASSHRPVLLVIDDAHWADASSVALLRHVVAHTDLETPLMVMVTFRDTDIDRTHALSGALGDLHRSARAERLSLTGLDETGILALLEGTAGHDLDREEDLRFVRRLVEETDGNPFFVGEVLRHMVETGRLVEEGGRWIGTVSVEEGGLPEGVRDVIGQRLSRLPDAVNDVLRAAAVIGREFDIGPLAEVLGRSEDEVVDDLDAALDARLVNEVEDRYGRLSFEHALVRQTLLEELSTTRRIRIHRRIAEVLDARGDTPIDVLAHHYCEAAMAGVAERAVEVTRRAAADALDALAFDEALALLDRAAEALEAIADPDPVVVGELLVQRARTLHANDPPAGRAVAREAAELARRIDDPVLLGEAGAAYLGDVSMWAEPGEEYGLTALREALDRLPGHDEVARARASAALAHGLLLSPGDEGLTRADEAVAVAEAADAPLALCQALIARAWTVRGVLPAAERVAAAERAIEVARLHDNARIELGARYLLGGALVAVPDLDGADEAFASYSETDPGAMAGWAIASFRASRAYAEGRFDEGDELAAHAYPLGASLGDTNDGIHHGRIVSAAGERGDLELALRHYELARATAVGAMLPFDAYAAVLFGRPEEASAPLRRWVLDVEPIAPAMLRYVAGAYVARTVFAVGDLCGADAYRAYVDRFAGELIGYDSGLNGAADWYRGLYAAAAGDLDAAVDLVTAGHALHSALGLRARVVQSGLDLATIRLRRGADGDRDAALTLGAETADLAAELGMTPSARAARELLG